MLRVLKLGGTGMLADFRYTAEYERYLGWVGLETATNALKGRYGHLISYLFEGT